MGTKTYNSILHDKLRDADTAAEYLSQAIEGGSIDQFLLALKEVTDAHGGIGTISSITDLNRQSMYKMLSEDGNPTLYSLLAVLGAIGIKVNFEAEKKDAA